VLVAGTSGSGKSEWLKSLVATLAFRNAPERVRLALVDPKILTFSSVETSPYLWRPLATDIGAALAVLESAVSEMENRYRTLAKEGFVSISDRIKAGRIDLPFIVLVFDEFADLILTGRDERKNFEEYGGAVGGKGASCRRPPCPRNSAPRSYRCDRSHQVKPANEGVPARGERNKLPDSTGRSRRGKPAGKRRLVVRPGASIARAQSYYIPQSDFVGALRTDFG